MIASKVDAVTDTLSLRQTVEMIRNKSNPAGLTVEEIIISFGTRSHAFVILFFTLPFVQPMPLFGLSTPAGMVIAIMGMGMTFGTKPWLPKMFLKKTVPHTIIEHSCNVLIRILNKTEKLIRPRGGLWISSRFAKIIDGILVAIFAFLLALPFPIPFSNTVPAFFLILNSIGWIERDSLLLMMSYVVAVLGVLFFIAIGGSIFELASFSLHKLQIFFQHSTIH